MNITQKIKDYQNNLSDRKEALIFLDLADSIIKDFPYRLNKKTYLLIPESRKELMGISYEYFFNHNKTMPISLSLDISAIMNKFNEVAEELGFTIITRMDEYHHDGELFDLLGSDLESSLEEISNEIPNINIPLTQSINEYLLRPFFPAVFKNETANRGEDIYLIENEAQLKKIIALFELPESKQINLKSEFIVQEYIKGLEEINSSIRVFTSCTGEILFSLFLISKNQISKKRVKNFGLDVFNPCEYLSDLSSPYYLDSKSIISNAAAGGKIIPLRMDTNNLSAEDEIILTLHGFNIETLSLPAEIIKQSKEISQYWGSKKGIVQGIDFIYDQDNNSWYYLETNLNPSVDGYRYFMNLNGFMKKDVKTLMQLESLMKIVENIMSKDIIIENAKIK